MQGKLGKKKNTFIDHNQSVSSYIDKNRNQDIKFCISPPTLLNEQNLF
jgi:hypothetical protein